MKNWKVVLVVIIVAGLIGAAVAYRMWNKPHEKVEDIAGVKVSVQELTAAYAANETKANEQYLNKVITVSGTIAETERNQDGNLVVILAGNDPSATVQCSMRDKGVEATKGNGITVKGFCNGSSLFGVLLSDCVPVK